ncbi:MAG TPA: TIGR00295 family protein [Thermoplasmatales archaeon]|nr:TIGR00295 family protein [Thermoplasmatales archaeon]
MYNDFPSPRKCIQILEKEGCSERVIQHCKAVRDLAVKIAEKAGADIQLVEVGSLLHDLGRCKTHGIDHAVEGARIARKLGLPDKVVNIIERHIGAGLTPEVAKKLGLPERDYTPRTLEEKIVCHADNLIDDTKRQNIEIEVKRALRNGYQEYAQRLIKLHEELSEICGVDLDKI